jgi:3-oxoacyl-[acyl-carrier-protein] synthase II
MSAEAGAGAGARNNAGATTAKGRRVVITGVGAITPLGATAQETWRAVRRGDCGIAPIQAYNTDNQAAKLAGEVSCDITTLVTPTEARKFGRFTQLALIAAREAFADSGISADNTDLDSVEVLIGSGIGGLGITVREQIRGSERGYDRVSPFFIPTAIANMAAGCVAIDLGLKGDTSCTVTACSTSAHALGEAMRHIRHGYADVVFAGGSESSVIPLAIGGFTALQALHTGSVVERASIPFDAERSGFVFGEGAGVLVLEEWEHAHRRGATIYAELSGFAATGDAYHITAPDPTGSGGIRAMKRALADAGLEASEIGYVNAHGTSTPLNDKGEVLALKAVFGDKSCPPVSSTKSMTGHLLGASGAVEALICAFAVRDGFVPATINYRVPDPECDLDIVPNVGREIPVAHALSNSQGFGGHNVALVVSRYQG